MKKVVRGLVVLVIAGVVPLANCSSVAFAYSGPGSGTPGSPYQISTCTELEEVTNNLSAYYLVTAPIDCTGVNFVPIGNGSSAFTGHFDGDGFPINNMTINSNTTYVGLFARVSGGTISNVNIESATVTGGIQDTGGLAGAIDTNATLSAIQVSGSTITGQSAVGGIAGSFDSSTVSHSSVASGTVKGSVVGANNSVGGLAGQSTNTTFATSAVIGTAVTGDDQSATSTQVGGFVGASNADTFNDSYATATVVGQDKVGGFVGASASSTFNRDYAAGSVTGASNVGGFSGYEGLNGIVDSFSAAAVSGTSHVGGLIGDVEGVGGDASNSYFDITGTGQTACVGHDDGISLPTTCTGVNNAGSQPNYFFGNTTNAPLAGWNFTTTWRANATDFPTFVSAPERTDNDKVVRGTNSMVVSWAYPADDGGSAVTSYDFGYRPYNSSGPFTITSGLSTSTLSQTVTGLTAGTQYEFAVRANNAVGHGTWALFLTSTLTTATTSVTLPNVTAPDTGYGFPVDFSLFNTILIVSSTISIGAGSLLFCKKRVTTKS